MKESSIVIKETLQGGLAQNKNLRNQPFLVESYGAVPFEKALVSVKEFDQIDISSLGTLTFPYPQLFVFSDVIVVCTPTDIYEYENNVLTHKIGPVTEGIPWSALDFKTYLFLTNGQVAVEKSPYAGQEYYVNALKQNVVMGLEEALPFAACACDFNGRVFLGSPNFRVSVLVAGDSILLEDGGKLLWEDGGRILRES